MVATALLEEKLRPASDEKRRRFLRSSDAGVGAAPAVPTGTLATTAPARPRRKGLPLPGLPQAEESRPGASPAAQTAEVLQRASAEDERAFPRILYAFYQHSVCMGKSELTSREYGQLVRALFEHDRLTPEAMASVSYAKRTQQRSENSKSHVKGCAALLAFKQFWLARPCVLPQIPAKEAVRYRLRLSEEATPKKIVRSKATASAKPRSERTQIKRVNARRCKAVAPSASVAVGGASPSMELTNRGPDEVGARTRELVETPQNAQKREWRLPDEWRVAVVAVSPGGTGYENDDQVDERLGRATTA